MIEAVDAAQAFTASSLDSRADDDAPAPGDASARSTNGSSSPPGGSTSRPAIRELPARERRILYLRFFENKTQSEIAAEIGISQMHVSRILTVTLAKLRGTIAPG